uniref:Secreted protein n=1 Tax=Arundo donax TaxID=35708 RepID=A0A0A9AS66_ARUDO
MFFFLSLFPCSWLLFLVSWSGTVPGAAGSGLTVPRRCGRRLRTGRSAAARRWTGRSAAARRWTRRPGRSEGRGGGGRGPGSWCGGGGT